MGIKTVHHRSYSPDLALCDFCLFPKLRGYLYETIEEMKVAVKKVIDTLTQEDFHGAFQKLLEWYNKCIAAGGDYFEGDKSFMCVLSIKVPIWKKSGNLFNDPRICLSQSVHIYQSISVCLYLCIYLSILSVSVYSYLSIYLSMSVSVWLYLSISVCSYLSIYLYISQS